MIAIWPRSLSNPFLAQALAVAAGAAALLVAAIVPAAGAAAPTLGGKYESNPYRYPSLALLLHQEGATASGSLTIVGDARSIRVVAVPVEGTVRRGQLSFNWEDNYGNAGNATFKADGKAYLLQSKMTRRSNDGRYFEGAFRLKKTGGDPGKAP